MFRLSKNLLPLLMVFILLPGSVFAQKYPYFTKASKVKIFPVFEVTITDKKTPKGRIGYAIQTKRKMYLQSVLVTKTEEGRLSPYLNHQLISRSVKKRSFRYALVVRPEVVYIFKIPALYSKESKPQLSFSPSNKNLLIRLDEDLTDSISQSDSISFKNASFSVLDVSEFGSIPKIKMGGVIPVQAPLPKVEEEIRQDDPESVESASQEESTGEAKPPVVNKEFTTAAAGTEEDSTTDRSQPSEESGQQEASGETN